ncbi:MAG: hypothetical protein Q4B96_03450 [Bacillota bacterium]|nr:hypothetical protein [Bacillota bacterium]
MFDSEQNYIHNRRLSLSVAEDNNGLIIHQRRLRGWRFGAHGSDYNGCGWIAAYNALLLLGRPADAAELIRELEGGLLIGGTLGVAPSALTRLLRRHGCTVRTSYGLRHAAPPRTGRVLIYGFLRRGLGGGHFVAAQRRDGAYSFYNDRGVFHGGWDQFAAREPARAHALLLIDAEGAR